MNLENVVSRVLAIASPSGDKNASPSDVLLVRDYFSRVVRLAKDVSAWSNGPFFDPEKLIGVAPDEATKAALDRFYSRCQQKNAYVKNICSDAIKWASYASSGNSIAASHADLYEPLLALFERQVAFGFHHGEVLVGDWGIPLTTWRDRYPP